jgi:hypothetical protein
MKATLVSFLLAAVAYGGSTTTVNFDTFPVGTILANQLMSVGIVFEPISHLGDPDESQLPSVQNGQTMQNVYGDGREYLGHVLIPAPSIGVIPGEVWVSGIFRLRFVDPISGSPRGVQSVSASFIDLEASAEGWGTLITAFDAEGNPLHQIQPSRGGDGHSRRFGISTEGNAIYSVELSLGNYIPEHHDDVWIDDLEVVVICDIDGDGDVDLSDLAALLAAYFSCTGDDDYNPDADFDGDGCVDLSDLADLLGDYGISW